MAVQAVNDSAQGIEVTKLTRMAGGVGSSRRNPAIDAGAPTGLSYGKVESCLVAEFVGILRRPADALGKLECSAANNAKWAAVQEVQVFFSPSKINRPRT